MSDTGDILRSMLLDAQTTEAQAQANLDTLDALYQANRVPMQSAVDAATAQVAALQDAIAQLSE